MTTKPAQFTPGPWTTEGADITNGYPEQGARVLIAEKVFSEHDAALIAAAPAMYEALQDAYEKLCYLAPDKFDDEEHAANWQRDLSTMLAALAQAEGRG